LLFESETDVGVELKVIEDEFGGPHYQVIGNIDGAIEFDLGVFGAGEFDVEGVVQANGLEDGAKFVIAIGALAEDTEIEIEFGEGRDGDAQAAIVAGAGGWTGGSTDGHTNPTAAENTYSDFNLFGPLGHPCG